MRWIGFAVLAMAIALAVRGAEPVAATQPEVVSKSVVKEGVGVSVVLAKTEFAADEQPAFSVRFTNGGTDALHMNLWGCWQWAGVELTNIDRAAPEPGPWAVVFHDKFARAGTKDRMIKPGESVDAAVDLGNPPYTFVYEYMGVMKHRVAAQRRLAPGKYRLVVTVAPTNPYKDGPQMWMGPVTTEPVEITITPAAVEKEATAEELAAYDAAIAKVTETLDEGGFWKNGEMPMIDLPADAKAEEVVDAAVNESSMGSKVYRVLRVRRFRQGAGAREVDGWAAVVRVGKEEKVMLAFPQTEMEWWNRFYEVDPPG